MKNHIWQIALAVALAFFAAGVVGMFVEAIFHQSHAFGVFFWTAIFGLVASLISIFHSQIYEVYKRLKMRILIVWNVVTRIKRCSEFLNLNNKQLKNPEKWLYPIIEIIDLDRQGSTRNDNDVYVKFQIDSSLLFPINEFYVFVKLCLAPDNCHSNESEWYEVKQPEHYPPIAQLERHRFSEERIHLIGETNGEKVLLEWIQAFKNDIGNGKWNPLLAMLAIGIKFKKDDRPIPVDLNILRGNGTRYMAPMSNYRGD